VYKENKISVVIPAYNEEVAIGLTLDDVRYWLPEAERVVIDNNCTDATAARVMNHDAAEIKQLLMANERGMGEMQEDSIEIVGEKLDDLKVEWTPAALFSWPKPAEAA